MTTYTILVTNIAAGCNNEIEQQLTLSACTSYIVRLTSNSNALGPFNVYLDDVIYYSAQTRTEMLNGVVVNIQCETPTPTPTPTVTPTPTPTDSGDGGIGGGGSGGGSGGGGTGGGGGELLPSD